MTDAMILDDLAVLSFVRRWFRLLNDHAPTEQVLALLATSGFELSFPEDRLTDIRTFSDWYRGVCNKFFDQSHEVKQVTVVDSSADGTELAIWVNWRARTWEAPAAYSTHLDFDAFQRWLLVAGPDGQPRIKRYIVEQLVTNRGQLYEADE